MRERPAKPADVLTISLFFCLLGIGWSMLFSVGYNGGYADGISDFLLNTQAGKQTIWVGIALITFFFTQIIERKFWQTFAYGIYVIAIVLLILVLFLGKEIKGATSWFAFGGFSLQPSEFAKFATCLVTASYLSRMNVSLRYLNAQVIAFGMILLPAALIMLQPDAGSALIFFSFMLLFYREGFPANFFILGFFAATFLILGIMFTDTPLRVVWFIIAAAVLGLFLNFKNLVYGVGGFLATAAVAWFALGEEWENLPFVLVFLTVVFAGLSIFSWLQGKRRTVVLLTVAGLIASAIVYVSALSFENLLARHQKDRINVWLNPEKCDPQGSLYNLIQSKSAIASGGLEGQGFLQGNMTQLNYVPEQSTDFIFSAIGEEQGFIGSLSIILFFLLLLWRITVIAERQRSSFVRCYAYGVAGILFMHFLVNIGMTMGLMPVIGIPLPFISKGGSSLIGFSLMIGVLLKMDKHRTET